MAPDAFKQKPTRVEDQRVLKATWFIASRMEASAVLPVLPALCRSIMLVFVSGSLVEVGDRQGHRSGQHPV